MARKKIRPVRTAVLAASYPVALGIGIPVLKKKAGLSTKESIQAMNKTYRKSFKELRR